MGLIGTKLQHRSNSLGIGGNAPGYNEFAIVILGDDELGRLFEFRLEAGAFIPDDSPEMREIDASVLGPRCARPDPIGVRQAERRCDP